LITASLTGQTEEHLCSSSDAEMLGASVHADVVAPFLQLRQEARSAGFEIEIDSGFRAFERQLSIWNRKATGQLAVLDSHARPLDIDLMNERELAFAILRWSALPGASRHHWGTDIDVIDAASLPEGYEVQLVPEEVDPGGMFGPLHDWLDQRIATSSAFGFFRPYDQDRNGVAPERWHLSFAPVTKLYEEHLSVDLLGETIRNAEIELRAVLLQDLDEIYERFVVNTGRQPT
jgi:LAS superfamily LD-carboxypeptidase LdcB